MPKSSLKYAKLCLDGANHRGKSENESALTCYLAAEKLMESVDSLRLNPEFLPRKYRLQGCIGDVYIMLSRLDEAKKYLEIAFKSTKEIIVNSFRAKFRSTIEIEHIEFLNDAKILLIEVAHRLGTMCILEQNNKKDKNYEQVKSYFFEAMAMAADLNNVPIWCHIALHWAKLQLSLHNYNSAEHWFSQIVIMSKEHPDKVMWAASSCFLGQVYCGQRMFTKAVECLNDSMSVFCSGQGNATASRIIANLFAKICSIMCPVVKTKFNHP